MSAAVKYLAERPGRSMAGEWQMRRNALRNERKHAALTQKELAAKAQLSEQQISRIENEGHSPRVSSMKRLAAALGIELRDLADWVISPENEEKIAQTSEEWARRRQSRGHVGETGETTDSSSRGT